MAFLEIAWFATKCVAALWLLTAVTAGFCKWLASQALKLFDSGKGKGDAE